MKNPLILTLISLFFSMQLAFASTNTYPNQQIYLDFHYLPISSGKPIKTPRTPTYTPTIYQNGHTILFGTTEFCNSVVLVDPCTEEVVYEMQVDATESQITLPSFLEGEYEIRFMRDTYYYSGIIVL